MLNYVGWYETMLLCRTKSMLISSKKDNKTTDCFHGWTSNEFTTPYISFANSAKSFVYGPAFEVCLDAITEVSFFKQPGVSLQISDTKKERCSALTQTVLLFFLCSMFNVNCMLSWQKETGLKLFQVLAYF